MDIRMPILSGIEANQILKQDPSTAKIPIVALTASIAKTEDELVALEFDHYLLKPIQRNTLVEIFEFYFA
jgi:CheY-like chemotaxis protein